MNNNLPDWITRNNSPERLSLLKSLALAKSDFDIQDHQDPGNWGLFTISNDGDVSIIAMGLTQDAAEELACSILEESSQIYLEIFQSWTFEIS